MTYPQLHGRIEHVFETPATASTAPGHGRTTEEFDVFDDSAERWLPVVGYEGLNASPSTRGYPKVTLTKDGVSQTLDVHRLVAHAFLPPPPHCDYQRYEVCHHDGDPVNNQVDNLRWDTGRANAADRIRHGRLPKGRNKTYCERGHFRTAENTTVYAYPSGRVDRQCLDCRKEDYVNRIKPRRAAARRAKRVATLSAPQQNRSSNE